MRTTRTRWIALAATLALSGGLGLGTAAAAPAPTGAAQRTAQGPLLPYATIPMRGVDDGAKFEGIGVDQRRGTYYVSETTGGEIHRGQVDRGIKHAASREWLAGDGTDGRWTARGITTDRQGRIYIAGGPNGIDHPGAPDLWVYSPGGALLAALRLPGDDVFVNDVAIGPDGAAYFSDSNDPRVFRVANGENGWQASLFADGRGTVTRGDGFNLGGIVTTADRSALLVAQGNAGMLWRVDLRTRAFSPVRGGNGLKDADGLVRHGNQLGVIRNFERHLTTLRVSEDGRRVQRISDRATDPSRVLTTGKLMRGHLMVVDSRFEEPAPTGDHEVVLMPSR